MFLQKNKKNIKYVLNNYVSNHETQPLYGPVFYIFTALYFEVFVTPRNDEPIEPQQLRVIHQNSLSYFLPRDAMYKRCLCRHAVSVRPSVCLSRSYIVERNNHLQNVFTIGQPHHSRFSAPNVMAIFRRDPANGGVECSWGRQKSRFSANISLSDR